MASGGLSRAGQHKVVGEGLAVAMLGLGVEAVTINEQVVESAFSRGWQKWTCRSRFPQVRTDVARNDIVGILRGSARRLGPHVADWSCEGQYVPLLRVALPIEEAGAAVGEQSGVSYSQWLELGTAFVDQLSEHGGEISWTSRPVRGVERSQRIAGSRTGTRRRR